MRWSLLPEDRQQEITDLAKHLEPPHAGYQDGDGANGIAHVRDTTRFCGKVDVQRCVHELLAEAQSAGRPKARQRQVLWGKLVGRNPLPQAGLQLDSLLETPQQQPETIHVLRCTKSYMVGRSRKSDIRIGHNAPMPYISSQHFKLCHAIRWPSPQACGGGSSERAPFLEALLEDLSQNGTFINGKQLGRGKQIVLQDGDKVELVFPEDHRQTVCPAHFVNVVSGKKTAPPTPVAPTPFTARAAAQ